MRAKCSVYVDVGYLLASASTLVTGTSLRSGVDVNYPKLLDGLRLTAEELTGLPVLRVNWYDAAADGVPDQSQEAIGLLPRVKLRLGRFGFDGQQKGVDLRIGLDMVAHARNNAIETIVLVSGDDDLSEAVEEAQVHGVQVILLAVPNPDGVAHAVSRHLQRAADELKVMKTDVITSALTQRQPRIRAEVIDEAPPVPAPKSDSRIPTPADLAQRIKPQPAERVVYRSQSGNGSVVADHFADFDAYVEERINEVARRAFESFERNATQTQMTDLERSRPSIPHDLDRALLVDLADALDIYTLDDDMRTKLRRRFWEIVDE